MVTDEVERSHLDQHWKRLKSTHKQSDRERDEKSALHYKYFVLLWMGRATMTGLWNATCLAMYSSASSISYFTVLHFAAVISTRAATWSAFNPCFTKCSYHNMGKIFSVIGFKYTSFIIFLTHSFVCCLDFFLFLDRPWSSSRRSTHGDVRTTAACAVCHSHWDHWSRSSAAPCRLLMVAKFPESSTVSGSSTGGSMPPARVRTKRARLSTHCPSQNKRLFSPC